jgi:hypothetical protein
MTYTWTTERRTLPQPPALLRCPAPDPDCPCHDKEPAAALTDTVVPGTGHTLEPGLRGAMEEGFGHDFGSVRVHSDARAARAARDMGALAYTLGSHVVFGPGEYAPGTPGGRRLLAHELAHVVQQGDRAPTEALRAARDGARPEALEREADLAADTVLAGRRPDLRRHHAAPALQRQAPAAAPKPSAAPAKPDREERLDLGRRGGHRMDAELDRRAGLLTVRMKVKFDFVDSPKRWPSKERQERWTAEFQALPGPGGRLRG